MNKLSDVLLAYLRQVMKYSFYSGDSNKIALVYLSKPVDIAFEIAIVSKYRDAV